MSDFNGDGRPDVTVANKVPNTVSVLLNNGTWSPPPPPLPSVRIGDRTVTEGNTGAANIAFTVTLSAASSQPVTIGYGTASGTAAAGSDFQATSGTFTIPAGQTSGTITVLVNGDRVAEPNESFLVSLSSPTGATIADGQGVGTIVDDEPRFSISGGGAVAEGNSGAKSMNFTVTLATAYDVPASVTYATADGSASSASGDYQAKTGTLTFNPGGPMTQNITVLVNGDRQHEANETFAVNLSGGGSAIATILNDDPLISISDVSRTEGKNRHTTLFIFTVTLSVASTEAVMMSYRTVNGTATTGNNDYVAKTGTLTFLPGETTKTITIEVKGDSKREGNETFYLDLFGLSSNAQFTKNRGLGTILNDD